jgi:cyanuric acid amidohydrolase
MAVELVSFDMAAPDDLGAVASAIDRLGVARIRRLSLLLRVAGEYTDGSRERARAAVADLLARHDLVGRSEYVTVVGAEGAATPCGYALIDTGGARVAGGPPRLAMGLARLPPCEESVIGTLAMARMTRDAVEAAMRDAGIAPDEVAAVIVNAQQPTEDVATRSRRGRAATALGAGAAIGEIDLDTLREADIVDNPEIFARRVHTFAGPGLDATGVIVLGNMAGVGGDLIARHCITRDLIDVVPIKRMLVGAGLPLDADGEVVTRDRLVATIAKLGARPDGVVRGAPTTIFGSATPPEKHVRAAMSGVLGAVLHTTRIFSTYDPVQQAPLGGGAICCILRADDRDNLQPTGAPNGEE